MVTGTYRVTGMTCEHCVRAVEHELRSLPGVIRFSVDLDPGLVIVTSDAPLDDTAVAAAVEEAGYEIATSARTGTR